MILVDSSVWIDHFHVNDPTLARLIDDDEAAIHPHILGEIALGHLRQRAAVLDLLREIQQVNVADDDEVLRLIETWKLSGTGLGYVDAHLLASLLLTPGAKIWTRDKRLHEAAARMGRAHVPSGGGVAEPPLRDEYAASLPVAAKRRRR